jgi:hypothetical protein
MNSASNTLDPSGFLVCAKFLQQGAVYGFVGLKYDEARLRSAINRAYMAAFCATRNHLLDRGQIPPRPASSVRYTEVQRSFLYNPDTRYQKIGVALEKLRRNQLAADYERALLPPLLARTYFLIHSVDTILNTLPNL